MRTALLTMELFRPDPEIIDGSVVSDELLSWVRWVLYEYALGESDFFRIVTSGGSDVKRLCVKIMTAS